MTIFDAEEWIIANCADAQALAPDTLRVVSNFTLMWNLFENTTCNNDAKVGTFDEIAGAIIQRGPLPDEVKAGVRFWTERYWTGTDFNYLFGGLEFRKNDREELVKAVLSGTQTDARSQLFAVMIIVYRLRNNLFHGLKTISMLNDQVSNLDMACRTLAAVVKASGRLP
jgi:hypothetical protein